MTLGKKLALVLAAFTTLIVILAATTILYAAHTVDAFALLNSASTIESSAYRLLISGDSKIDAEEFSRAVLNFERDLGASRLAFDEQDRIRTQIANFQDAQQRHDRSAASIAENRHRTLQIISDIRRHAASPVDLFDLISYVHTGDRALFRSAKTAIEELTTNTDDPYLLESYRELDDLATRIYIDRLAAVDEVQYMNTSVRIVGEQIQTVIDRLERRVLSVLRIVTEVAATVALLSVGAGIILFLLVNRYLTTFLLDHENAVSAIQAESFSFTSSFRHEDELGDIMGILEKLAIEIEDRTTNLRSLASERETLLREVHHRTKNNLQVILSLISLKRRGDRTRSPTTEVLVEIENHIHAIAAVHETLYSSGDLGRVNIEDYLREISSATVRALAPSRDIVLEIVSDVEPLLVPASFASALGMAANELLTNSIKYGMTDAERRIVLDITQVDSTVYIRIGDGGPGIPEECRANPQSAGLLIVESLVTKQINGSIEYETSRLGGAGWRIAFPYTKHVLCIET